MFDNHVEKVDEKFTFLKGGQNYEVYVKKLSYVFKKELELVLYSIIGLV